MSQYRVVAETNENTVVTNYEPLKQRSDAYQSEAELEKEFIRMLTEQGYTYLQIHTEADLIANLRERVEELNNYKFSDTEWERFFQDCLANENEKFDLAKKTSKIQEDYVQVLKRDDGLSKNITLIDRKNVHNNRLQVINQYVINQSEGARHDNRYDVTILVNGLPLVHIELKRRGVKLREAFNQINRYEKDSFWAGSGLFNYVQIFVISNGTRTKYYSNSTRWNAIRDAESKSKNKTSNSFEFTSYWADEKNKLIPDLIDFTRTFFAKHTILNLLTKYCVFTSDSMLMVMRSYQIAATEKILNQIDIAHSYKRYGTTEAGGFIWHTTGSGKTLTSFKTARLASQLPYIFKVLFVVDRKDLDYQTMKEYDKFEQGAANSNSSTNILEKQLKNPQCKIIITTIQKLATFIKKFPGHQVFDEQVVIIFDECHRSQFGDMHKAIAGGIDKKGKRIGGAFKKYYIFGFTGTPIFPEPNSSVSLQMLSTEQLFGRQLHTYTIVDAIRDANVLPFRVDYYSTIQGNPDIDDEEVWDIDRKKTLEDPRRIKMVAEYILTHFDQKTYRGDKSYYYNSLVNIEEVASAKNGKVEEIKARQRISGFNSIFAVASVKMAKLYYEEFRKQIDEDPTRKIRIAVIYSYGANEEDPYDEEADGPLEEENPEETSAMGQTARDFLDSAIRDYNEMFHTNYSTDSDRFQNYYKDVSLRMKNKELDMLIVVNMFLTGFDATTLNTLWVDKNLKMHGLIQAFSRTNRILNSVKSFGNIVCFRNLQKRVDKAISKFGDENAGGVVLLRSFKEYLDGYITPEGKKVRGYNELILTVKERFPVDQPVIEGEQNQKEFINLFGEILRKRNILLAFDDFAAEDVLSERDLQDYLSIYQDLRDEWRRRRERGDSADISDDVVFEIELLNQIEINIDYILMLVKKYHDDNCRDVEILESIKKAVDASPELRSKKALIEAFLAGINDVSDVMNEWYAFVAEQREKDLAQLIEEERLNPDETRKFLENAFKEGGVKTTGTDIDKMMPPVSRFGNSNRSKKKQTIIDKLKAFFEKYFGLGAAKLVDIVENETSRPHP